MAQAGAKIRLHVAADLGLGREVALGREQAHYLFGVMRRGPGDTLRLFNGRDGEWLAEIVATDRRGGLLVCCEMTLPQSAPPDLWLLFAPIKKARTDFIAEKACEMGCRRLIPVFTAHTNAERVNTGRLRAHAVEAAEQCGLVSVPEVAEPVALGRPARRLAAGSADPVLRRDRAAPARRRGAAPRRSGPLGGADRPRGRFLARRGAAPAPRPAGACRLARAPHPARRHRGGRGADPLAEHARRLAVSFVRPEVVEALRRYGEPAVYAAIAALCLWKGVALMAAGAWIGLAPLALGLVAAFAVLGTAERALVARRSAAAGPGIVTVQEGRISYFGPHGGATVAVDALVRIDILTTTGLPPVARWELTDETAKRLAIPASAANAGALLDVLGGLPGFNNMAVVLAMQADEPRRTPIWRRAPSQGDRLSRSIARRRVAHAGKAADHARRSPSPTAQRRPRSRRERRPWRMRRRASRPAPPPPPPSAPRRTGRAGPPPRAAASPSSPKVKVKRNASTASAAVERSVARQHPLARRLGHAGDQEGTGAEQRASAAPAPRPAPRTSRTSGGRPRSGQSAAAAKERHGGGLARRRPGINPDGRLQSASKPRRAAAGPPAAAARRRTRFARPIALSAALRRRRRDRRGGALCYCPLDRARHRTEDPMNKEAAINGAEVQVPVGRPVPARGAALGRGADDPRHGARLRPGKAGAPRRAGLCRGKDRPRHLRRDGRAGPARRDDPRGIWRRRRQLRLLWPGRPRGRALRFGLSLDDVGAVLAGDVPDPRLRLGGPAQALSARPRAAASWSAASA